MKIEAYSPTIRRKEMDAVLTVMVEDKIGPGEQAKILIQMAREKLRFDYCLALRSPAFALHVALKSFVLEKGTGVLVSAFSPLYYDWVIRDLGLIPVYCDVMPFTACIGRETVEKALSSRPAGLDISCIALHHTLGYQSDAAAIAEFGFPLIEDHSQSYASAAETAPTEETAPAEEGVSPETSSNKGFPPSIGELTIIGLEERDMLTSGGGALLYSASRRTSRSRDGVLLRTMEAIPLEYGLPDMNAALAVVQFKEAAKNSLKRREIARLYSQAAQRTRHKRFLQNQDYNNYAFPIILETGVKDVKAYARKKDIVVESAFENTLIGRGIAPSEQCPEAYSLSLRTILFPLYPRLSMDDAGKVAKLIQTLP